MEILIMCLMFLALAYVALVVFVKVMVAILHFFFCLIVPESKKRD